MAVLIANNAYSSLASAISDTDTTITLATGTGARFPSISGSDYFYATLIDTTNNIEVVKVTARSSDTLTVERAADDTTARWFPVDARIELRVTAQLLRDVRDSVAPSDDSVTTVKIQDGAVSTDKLADGAVTSTKMATAAAESLAPTGALMPFAGTTAPSGWLLCYGQTVSRTTYAALFAIIGTTYGAGDGSSTFTLPDLRGRVIAGQDDMGGTSANRLTNQTGGLDGDTLGAAGGAETHTLTTAQMPSHRHTMFRQVVSNSYTYNEEVYAAYARDSDGNNDYYVTSTTQVANIYGTKATGGDGAHNNVQPTIILNYIIRT